VAKTILKILANHAVSNFDFLFLGDWSWVLYACLPIASEPCGHAVLKILIKFDSPHMLPRNQWQLCSSMGQGSVWLIFCVKIRRWNTEYFAEHRVSHVIIGFDLLSNRKELPIEKMRCSFSSCSDTQFKSDHWQINRTTYEKNATPDL
jgi:hypothetical protein